MANKILSVVVPTYNMEKYLPRCLDSVTRKDVPKSLEVIVVNDGSTDESLKIAKEYQAKRPDIISIINKPNGHYGSCINAALKVATGKYFRPLDADDWFDTNALINFLNKIREKNVDLAITNYIAHRKSRSVLYNAKDALYEEIYRTTDAIFFKQQDMMLAMHSFTYKTSILRDCKLSLTEGLNYTDTEYVFYPLRHVKDISFFNDNLYNYDMSRDNQSVSAESQKNNIFQQAQLLREMIGSSNSFSFIEQKILGHYLKNFYYRLIFCFERDSLLNEIDSLIKINHPKLKNVIDKKTFFASKIWRLTGIHFFWYEKLKKLFGIDR